MQVESVRSGNSSSRPEPSAKELRRQAREQQEIERERREVARESGKGRSIDTEA